MVSQTKPELKLQARVPDEMVPMYRSLLEDGHKPSEIAREGIRSMYRRKNKETQEATA